MSSFSDGFYHAKLKGDRFTYLIEVCENRFFITDGIDSIESVNFDDIETITPAPNKSL